MLKWMAVAAGLTDEAGLGLWNPTPLWGLMIAAGLVLMHYGIRGHRSDSDVPGAFTRVTGSGYDEDGGR